MQTIELGAKSILKMSILAATLLLAPGALAFEEQANVVPNMSPTDAFIAGSKAYREGDTARAISALELAAKMGHAGAQWKLGRMYADGDGVERNDTRAFEYFSQLADQHADDNPHKPNARFIAEAFVAVAGYYLSGIPDLGITSNLNRAVDLVRHAATYFGDTDAQYQLARMYMEGQGTPRNPERAIRWLAMAAKNNHIEAQGDLGSLLLNGTENMAPRPVQGLMWLEIASRNSEGADAGNRIHEARALAFSKATDRQRERALAKADRWMKKHSR